MGADVLGEAGAATELAALAADALRAQAGAAHAGRRMARNSDQSFWGVGVPSIFGTLSHQPEGPVKMRNSLGWWWHTPDDLIDKVDPRNLVRDTRVYAHAVGRLLTDAVLPIDHAAQAEALLAELRALLPAEARGVDLGAPVAAVEALRARAAAIGARRAGAGPTAAARLDAALMRACRALVPLDHTRGDRFAHDPALPQPAWPALEPLRRLAAAAPDTDAARLLAVGARRARNRVAHAATEAAAALETGLRDTEIVQAE